MTDRKTRPNGDLPQNVKCPRCGQISPYRGNPYRPFCTERCQIIDRGAWADESYKIASEDAAPLDDDEG